MERGRPSSSFSAFRQGALAVAGVALLAAPAWTQTSQTGARYSVVDKEIRWRGLSALGPTDPTAAITVRRDDGTTVSVEVPLHQRDLVREQADELQATLVADRVLIVFPSESYCKEVTTVDLPSGKIVDNFAGCRVSLSPDNTRAVYRYHYGAGIMDEVVVAYDFTRTPTENASPGKAGRLVPKGVILYPAESRARGVYRTKSEPLVTVASPFAWCGNDRIAFLSAIGDETHLIEMSLPEDARHAKLIGDRRIDAGAFRSKVPTGDWPHDHPHPPFAARELSYQDGCRGVRVVPLASDDFEAEVVTLAANESVAP